MEKIEIRSIGVIMAVMILSSFAAGQSTDSFWCNAWCKIKCAEEPFPEPNCVKNCESHCSSSDPVYGCITACQKSIAIKNGGAGHLGNNLMNTCMQECKKRF
ncbi:hypothetical protein LR48_Vigan2467s000100 [Vigna angularis]|uniref:Knottin scorpion toxin-like domain-containing protein n=1 Tax=Vigna angularis var. angularis TaxID=157739 RepID=A0A0S3S9K6_PHAAN|nr:uncharacterized protein LOC108318807 [Vigna angularis]XP_052733978.1 uncharacterized protein LOC128196590 [Vigna angularis]KOM24725.1 hypothetical protein LR48_Vigan2467s000100 [Vigna angularis]BAT89490.1 hypothetical protein VIGAN_06045400 [Vigna angularis var. angularis]